MFASHQDKRMGARPARVLAGAVLTIVGLILTYALFWSGPAQTNTSVDTSRPPVPPLPTPPPGPVQIDYNRNDLSSVDAISFFEHGTGKPLVWYYRTADGTYELFNRPGLHPRYKRALEPITWEIVGTLRTRAKAVALTADTNATTVNVSADSDVEPRTQSDNRVGLPSEQAEAASASTPARQSNTSRTASSRPKAPSAFVVATDESGSPWTTPITLEELERKLLLLANVHVLRRSELPEDISQELSQLRQQDRPRLIEIAHGLNTTHIVLGTCVEAREDSGRLLITVRIQILDVPTGEITHSQGHEGWGYLNVDTQENIYRKSLRGIANLFFSGRPKLTLQ